MYRYTGAARIHRLYIHVCIGTLEQPEFTDCIYMYVYNYNTETMKSVIEKEQSEKTIKSLSEHVKKLTVENTSQQDRIKKLGFLQNEGRQLGSKVAERLKVVTQEKEEIRSMTRAEVNLHLDITVYYLQIIVNEVCAS